MVARVPICVIGSYPHDGVPNWFSKDEDRTDLGNNTVTDKFSKYHAEADSREAHLDSERERIIRIHENLDVDVITDGEVGRENYIHFLLRSWQGIDFDNLEEKTLRDGAYKTLLPVIREPLVCPDAMSGAVWKRSSLMCLRPQVLKYTLPGPLTILDSVVNRHYRTEKKLLFHLADLINREMLSLQQKGCEHIQLDEPVYARYPAMVQEFGPALLERCFRDVTMHKSLHICCGYPNKLEQTDYHKADPTSYLTMAGIIDDSPVDSVSIENSHQQNDLSILLPCFKKTIVILGVLRIATRELEDVDEIVDQGMEAAKYLPPDRLWLSPDCGLGMLPQDIAAIKLRILTEAATKLRAAQDRKHTSTPTLCLEADDE